MQSRAVIGYNLLRGCISLRIGQKERPDLPLGRSHKLSCIFIFLISYSLPPLHIFLFHSYLCFVLVTCSISLLACLVRPIFCALTPHFWPIFLCRPQFSSFDPKIVAFAPWAEESAAQRKEKNRWQRC